jgi:hypothetical protein
MKKTILALLASLTVAANASTVSLSNSPSGPAAFLPGNTTKVTNGSLVRVGMIGNLADPMGTFVEFGTSVIRNAGVGGSAVPGKVVGSVTATGAESTHDQFNNQTVYLWIYSTATASSTADQGIFATTRTFPANDVAGVGDDTTVLVGTEVLSVVNLPAEMYTAAQILPGDAVDSKHFVLGAFIPEPTTSSIFVLGALGLLLRRRR